ncbi:MAG: SDR family oxidoreductase [Sulfuritalea sp.]|jgi:UDP-glucose 4-epimerase|nr:SDR family oxidoreductase [Sulfuritalea sp.]
MKIVVTGGLGHIGSRLVRELPRLIEAAEILIVDNLSTQRYGSLFDLPGVGGYRFIEGDVTNMDLRESFTGADAVVHLAALTDAVASFEHPEAMERVNFAATKHVAEMCVQIGVPMIHVSSTSVYGTLKTVIDENCGPEDIAPQSPYADCKRREELLVETMCRTGGLKAITLRFGTIFGTSPGMRFHTAVNRFCWQAVMGKPLTVWKTAYDQRRPYLELGDAVRAVAFAVQGKLFDGNIYNAVTVNATVREVTDAIRLHLPDLTIDFVDSRIMNTLSYEVLNKRLSASGFEMHGSMRGGIADTVKLLKNANSRGA